MNKQAITPIPAASRACGLLRVGRAALALGILALASCDRPTGDAPPTIALGQDVCDQCNMIISDERFASATVVQGRRGPEALLFDDFNCQAQHESLHKDQQILARWSHDHETLAWFHAETGWFLASDQVRSPMGSLMAAFATKEAALRASEELEGQIMSFERAWRQLVPPQPIPPVGG